MLRLFRPDDDLGVSAKSSLQDFFEAWYIPTAQSRAAHGRRPISNATIDRRRAAVSWWTKLMRSLEHPEGPPIGQIDGKALIEFRERLKNATFRRGRWTANRYALSEVTQVRTIQEVQIVVATAGPASGSLMRAGLLTEAPAIYMPPIEAWPKPTWSLDEARSIVAAIRKTSPPHCRPRRDGTRPIKLDADSYWRLCEATVALWFYTGQRATTYERLMASDLIERSPGQWYLQFRAVKTNKLERIAVHPALLTKLRSLRQIGPTKLIPWPVGYTTIDSSHYRWQKAAGLKSDRQFSPQAWRRLHADQVAATGFALARGLAQSALGHSSASVTEAHYTSARDAAVLMLPDLWAD